MGDRVRLVWLSGRLAVRAGRWRVLVVVACGLLLALQPVANAVALRMVTDGAVSGDHRQMVAGIVILVAMIAVMFSAYGISVPLQTTVSEQAMRLFEQDVMSLVSSIPTLEAHERPDFADKLEVLRTNSRVLVSVLWRAVANLSFFTGIAAGLTLLASASPALLLLPLFGIPLLLAARKGERMKSAALDRNAGDSRLAQHFLEVATTPALGKELRVFGLRQEISARYARLSAEIDDRAFSADLRASLLATGAWLLFAAAWAAGIVLTVHLALAGELTPGQVVMTIIVAGLVQGYVSGGAGVVRDLTQTLAAADRFLWLRDVARRQRRGGGDPPGRLRTGIRLDRVCFSYPGTQDEVLRDVSVTLPAGATVALVGDNGAGKTTVVKLLLALYQPTSGRITVDGTDLADIDPPRWRGAVSGAFQDYARLEFTVGRSVGVGDIARVDDGGAVRTAMRRAGASVPLPLDQQLGQVWQGGIDVSTGQWQQIAVARGMMRDYPLLLVLDEPTASLDADTEDALFRRYRAASRRTADDVGAITLLVSHRFSTVGMADLILVFDHGQIVERGSHDELMAARGLYSELFRLQARGYQ